MGSLLESAGLAQPKPAAGDRSIASADFLAGGGEMGERIRALDWSRTALGPIKHWSASLRTMVSFMLANRFPLLLWWGPEYISIYNDAYRPVLGAKHPWALGLSVNAGRKFGRSSSR